MSQQLEAAGYVISTVRRQRELLLSTHSLLIPGAQVFPIPVKSVKIIPHKHSQRPVSQVILDSVKLKTRCHKTWFVAET